MSHGDDLRQLVAQLTMLAAFERRASPGSWAPLAQVGLQPPPPLASLRRPQLLQRPWCQPPPVPVLALALPHRSGLVTGLAVKSCPPVCPAQLRLSRLSRATAAASGTPRPSGEASEALAPAQASEASCVPDVASDSDSDWDALLDAHGLAPPPNVAAAAVAQPADAAGTGRRARDKRRRRLRKVAKRSMWRVI